MHLHSYRLHNFRRLCDVHIELADDISIFVGANNSGKTSATQALQMFLSSSKDRFSLYDFSSHTWKTFDAIGDQPIEEVIPVLPSISIDLWFEVAAADLHLVIPLLPSTTWEHTLVGIRVEFGAKDHIELVERFRAARANASAKVAAMEGGPGKYVPWPKSLSDYLLKELKHEYEFRYFVLDRAQFDETFKPRSGYEPLPFGKEPSGAAILESLIRVDTLNAQRHLADPSANAPGGMGRSEDLSKRLSRFYQRNLDQRQEDHKALKALFDSEAGLNEHLARVFEPTLKRLSKLGYPGLNNPRLEIRSALNPATVMSQDARVHYVLGKGQGAPTLPDTYNGLGFKNLIYMVVEILDRQANWIAEKDTRPPLHLIFIEEPEAHLHAQLQQVFIRNLLTLLQLSGEDVGSFHTQSVITTHSPHILYERGFRPIRYFRRHIAEDGTQSAQVLNLSAFYAASAPEDRDFLQRYLKLTHCDLFFADAAILVEGNVERLLLPVMIEKEAASLRSACLCLLEVGGAFGHRFKALIEFLGMIALIVTDLDSVTLVAEGMDADEDEDREFAVPDNAGQPKSRFGKTCSASTPGAVTSNQTLIRWLPGKHTVTELLATTADDKIQQPVDGSAARVCVTYQGLVPITMNGVTSSHCGRTLEEAFGLENAAWCQDNAQRYLGLKLRAVPQDGKALADGLHKRVTGKGFDKTKFALGVLTAAQDQWVVPAYIRQGLEWLKMHVDFEAEAEAAVEVVEEAMPAAEHAA